MNIFILWLLCAKPKYFFRSLNLLACKGTLTDWSWVLWKYLGFCEPCWTGIDRNSDRNPAVTASLLVNHILLQGCYLQCYTQSGSAMAGFCSSVWKTQLTLLRKLFFEFSPSDPFRVVSLVLVVQFLLCFFFSQNNNSHRAGAAASAVATEMVARVTYIWQLLYCITLLSLPSCERAQCKIGSTLSGSPRIDLEISDGQSCRPSRLISTDWRSSRCLFCLYWGAGEELEELSPSLGVWMCEWPCSHAGHAG